MHRECSQCLAEVRLGPGQEYSKVNLESLVDCRCFTCLHPSSQTAVCGRLGSCCLYLPGARAICIFLAHSALGNYPVPWHNGNLPGMLLFLREGVVSVCAVALELPGILLERQCEIHNDWREQSFHCAEGSVDLSLLPQSSTIYIDLHSNNL